MDVGRCIDVKVALGDESLKKRGACIDGLHTDEFKLANKGEIRSQEHRIVPQTTLLTALCEGRQRQSVDGLSGLGLHYQPADKPFISACPRPACGTLLHGRQPAQVPLISFITKMGLQGCQLFQSKGGAEQSFFA